MSAQQFRKKPVVIEAVKWTGNDGPDLEAVLHFVYEDDRWMEGLESEYVGGPGVGFVPALGTLDIPTLEGVMTASPGDWIIRGVKGELYPCKPDIFDATYEPVSTTQEDE